MYGEGLVVWSTRTPKAGCPDTDWQTDATGTAWKDIAVKDVLRGFSTISAHQPQ